MLIYLSGAIEYAPDKGKGWRAALTPFLRSLGHEVYDPAEDVRKDLTDEEVACFRSWKATDLPRFQKTVRKIIAWDMAWIERRCDCVIALWDQYTQRGAGSSAELTLAHRRGIPVYMVAGMPVEQISGWILGCATEVFADFEQLKSFLAAKSPVSSVPSVVSASS
jgi:nucleoside 2-deoxyribosyltransferase